MKTALGRLLVVSPLLFSLGCDESAPARPDAAAPGTMLTTQVLPTAEPSARRPVSAQDKAHDHALQIVAKHMPASPVILEGGSFDGTDTVRMAKRWPAAKIYSFEPVPKLFQRTRDAARPFENVTVYELALADKIGTATFHISESKSKPGQPGQSGSLLAPEDHTKVWPQIEFKRAITVKTTTIDAWAEQHGVERIDFMWLDIQGVELPAMKGAPRIMKTVKAIHMEVEFVELYKGQALFDETRDWLGEQGLSLVASDFDANKDTTRAIMGNAIFVRK